MVARGGMATLLEPRTDTLMSASTCRPAARQCFAILYFLGVLVCVGAYSAEAPAPGLPPGPTPFPTRPMGSGCPLPTRITHPSDSLTPSTSQPAEDVLQECLKVVSRLFVPRDSAWLDTDRRIHEKMLEQRPVQTLVIPAQVQAFATDRISRSLWTADLTYSLAEHGVTVADPYLVMRALGEGQRTIPLFKSDELAKKLRATRLIETFLGHDQHQHLTVLVRVYDKSSPDQSALNLTPQTFAWTDLEFSDERPPAIVVRDILLALLQKLHTRTSPNEAREHKQSTEWLKIDYPERPDAFGMTKTITEDAALRLALLGALAPVDDQRAAERLYEKSWLALYRSNLPVEQARFLQAYVLFKLKMRPAALALLGADDGDPTGVLRELMNGNLKATEVRIARLHGTERLLLEIELRDLAERYGAQVPSNIYQEVTTLAARGPLWNTLIAQRFGDVESGKRRSNLAFKTALDTMYAIHGYTARDVLEQTQALGPRGNTDAIELSVAEHARRAWSTLGAVWCKSPPLLKPAPWDILDIVEASAEANLVGNVRTDLDYLGLPDAALRDLDLSDAYYAGQPIFSALRAMTNARLAAAAALEQRGRFDQDAKDALFLTLLWAQGQSESAVTALQNVAPGNLTFQILASAYSGDFPSRDYWYIESIASPGAAQARAARARSMLAYTQSSLTGIEILKLGDAQQKNEARDALAHRFQGSPAAAALRALLAPDQSSPGNDAMFEAIKENPQDWATYRVLGFKLAQDGDFKHAADVIADFPAFKDNRGEDTVTLANSVYEMASLFYWLAEIEPAKRLNLIAAHYNNGSSASLGAAQRLRTMDRDFEGALRIARERSDRYGDEYAYRDYITLLYALGQRRQATATFDAVALQPAGPAPWHAALFGQRLMKLKDADVRGWLRERVVHSEEPRARRNAAEFALLWNATDRVPANDLPDLVRDLAHDPIGRSASSGVALYPSLDHPGSFSVVNASAFRRNKRPVIAADTKLDSDVTLFARGYVALRHDKFLDAVHLFDDLASHYGFEFYVTGGSAQYALPYFAYASSKVGDPLALEQFLATVPQRSQGFDHYLAKAFFEAARGERERSIDDITKAYNHMSVDFERPIFIDQQFIEACEWLYAEMPDQRLRNLMLDFADRYRIVNPFRVWPYTVEARYAPDSQARAEALGMVAYLDLGSMRLQQFTPAEISKARQWAQNGHPFGTARPASDLPPDVHTTAMRPAQSRRNGALWN